MIYSNTTIRMENKENKNKKPLTTTNADKDAEKLNHAFIEHGKLQDGKKYSNFLYS